MKQQRRAPRVFQVFQAEVNIRTNDAGIPGNRGTNQIRRQFHDRVAIERRGQPFLGQFDAVALHTGEADFQVIALGTHGFDLDGLARRLWGRDYRSGGEVERHPRTSAYSTLNRPSSLRGYPKISLGTTVNLLDS